MARSFNKLVTEHDNDIKTLCKAFANNFAKYKVEYDDLYQEVMLKLLMVENIESKEHLLIIAKNHLLDVIRKWKLDPLSEAECLGLMWDIPYKWELKSKPEKMPVIDTSQMTTKPFRGKGKKYLTSMGSR